MCACIETCKLYPVLLWRSRLKLQRVTVRRREFDILTIDLLWLVHHVLTLIYGMIFIGSELRFYVHIKQESLPRFHCQQTLSESSLQNTLLIQSVIITLWLSAWSLLPVLFLSNKDSYNNNKKSNKKIIDFSTQGQCRSSPASCGELLSLQLIQIHH